MTDREDRNSKTRDETLRAKSWQPPSILPDPKPEPGYKFRWIRTSLLGLADNPNVSVRFREGWQPVRAEDHPELQIRSDHKSAFKGNVEVGGLLLCKIPEEDATARQRYYEQLAEKQLEAVDNSFMKENDPRMPLLKTERTTRVQMGRRPAPEPDDKE